MMIVIVLATVLSAVPSLSAQATSAWVFYGSDSQLHYQNLPTGDHIMDFSFAGYQGGGVALPNVPVQQTVSPSGADDTAAIKAAISAVAALPMDANGFRGAVLLNPGTYTVSSTLAINTSGVVVRGSGSGPDGTVIIMNPTAAPFLLFSISGTGSFKTVGSSTPMTDSYVPSGAMSFHVNNPEFFSPGDTVLVGRPVTAAWIHFMNMDTLVRDGAPQTWISAGTVIQTDRTITAINGTQITLDVPLTDSFDSQFVTGKVQKYTFTGRISQVGVEHLSVVAPPLNADISLPQFNGVSMNAVINGWAQDLVLQDTQNTVFLNGTSKQITLDNIHVKHTVNHTGDRMTDFGISGVQVFLNKSSSDGNPGEWPFVTESRAPGPNVLLNFESQQQAGISAHQRWATGLLADNATLPNSPNGISGGTTGISFGNRGNAGSGQGWAMGWGVAWNATTPHLVVEQFPGGENWCIGCVGSVSVATQNGVPVPNGIFDSLGAHVTPSSLYLAQLCQRLGPQAATNIGYDGVCATLQPDFTVSAAPGSQTVAAAGSATITTNVGPIRAYSGTANLSVTGLPDRAAPSFAPASIAGGSGSSTLTFSTSIPSGTYTVTVTATDSLNSGMSHSTTASLTITPISLPVTASGLLFSRVNQNYSGTVTVLNNTGNVYAGPLYVTLSGLTPGVTLTNSPATISGLPAVLIVPAATTLNPGDSVTAPVVFSDPSNARITFTPVLEFQ